MINSDVANNQYCIMLHRAMSLYDYALQYQTCIRTSPAAIRLITFSSNFSIFRSIPYKMIRFTTLSKELVGTKQYPETLDKLSDF